MTLSWDTLPEDQLKVLLDMTGQCELIFEDVYGEHTEPVVRTSAVHTATRLSHPNGRKVWKDVSVEVKFINAHN